MRLSTVLNVMTLIFLILEMNATCSTETSVEFQRTALNFNDLTKWRTAYPTPPSHRRLSLPHALTLSSALHCDSMYCFHPQEFL
jgi:hypothetical protein